MKDLTTRAKVDCGLAGIQDLRTNVRDDKMESFALSETLKVRHNKQRVRLDCVDHDYSICFFYLMRTTACTEMIRTTFSPPKDTYYHFRKKF